MALSETVAALVLGGGVGALASLVGLGYLSSYVEMRRSDPVDVRHLTDPSGTVELTGTARVHEETGRSPFTDTESPVYRWTTEYESRSPNGPNWPALDSGKEVNPFLLEDDTGTVLVDPAGGTRQFGRTATVEVDGDESPPPAVVGYLDETDEVDRKHDRKRRYSEFRIDPGDEVHVLGPVRESGHSVDMPGGVDAVVGVESPEDRGFTVGEDGLSELVDQIRADAGRFVVSNRDEVGAERAALKTGLIWLGVGLLFLAVPLALLILG